MSQASKVLKDAKGSGRPDKLVSTADDRVAYIETIESAERCHTCLVCSRFVPWDAIRADMRPHTFIAGIIRTSDSDS